MGSPDGVTGLAAARISVPQPPSSMLIRPHLTRLLDEATRRPLTIVTGGPGTGKTTAVAEWTRDGVFPGPVAWVSLDRFLSTPHRVWAAIAAALESALGVEALGSLRPPRDVDEEFIEALSTRLWGHGPRCAPAGRPSRTSALDRDVERADHRGRARARVGGRRPAAGCGSRRGVAVGRAGGRGCSRLVELPRRAFRLGWGRIPVVGPTGRGGRVPVRGAPGQRRWCVQGVCRAHPRRAHGARSGRRR